MKYCMRRLLVHPVLGFLLVVTVQAGGQEKKVLTPSELTKLMQQAAKGNLKAQSRVGLTLARSEGTWQDYPEAVKWLSAAAEQGDPAAEHNLALMYFEGRAVNRDETQAASWFQKAARAGLPQA